MIDTRCNYMDNRTIHSFICDGLLRQCVYTIRCMTWHSPRTIQAHTTPTTTGHTESNMLAAHTDYTAHSAGTN